MSLRLKCYWSRCYSKDDLFGSGVRKERERDAVMSPVGAHAVSQLTGTGLRSYKSRRLQHHLPSAYDNKMMLHQMPNIMLLTVT